MAQQRMEKEEERPSSVVGRENRKYDFLSLQERKQQLLSDARRFVYCTTCCYGDYIIILVVSLMHYANKYCLSL